MNPSCVLIGLAILISFSACSKSPPEAGQSTTHAHHHQAPHGGTTVVLGDELYHLEWVHEPAKGTLTAYVLDAHTENFIRLPVESFEIVARVGGEDRSLVFHPVASAATGETVGNTSQFEAQADWLKTTLQFDARLKSLNIRGTKFKDVPFSFPQANHH